MKPIQSLHYLTQDLDYTSHAKLAENACKAGVKWIQFRSKIKDLQALKEQALEVVKICKEFGVTVIINDHVELAKEVEADGVHIGKKDMPVNKARHVLGADKIIGLTGNSIDDILAAKGLSINYMGVGPFRYTATKQVLSPVLGLQGAAQLVKQARILGLNFPLVAIGGIESTDIKDLIDCGFQGVAVSSAIHGDGFSTDKIVDFLKEFQGVKNVANC